MLEAYAGKRFLVTSSGATAWYDWTSGHLTRSGLPLASLDDLRAGARVRGLIPAEAVTIKSVTRYGENSAEIVFADAAGRLESRLVTRDDEPTLEVVDAGRRWSFDGDGELLRLVSEAKRLHLAWLFDPYLAVSTSVIDPLPHQISAVYEEMLPRQPMRSLLADDPGAGKTIMAGLFIKELIVRGDLARCLIVAPGSLCEQWQDELGEKFGIDLHILTRDMIEEIVLDHATAAQTVGELQAEIVVLERLEKLAKTVRYSADDDSKWTQLSSILDHPLMRRSDGSRRKLVIFTEFVDTLTYLSGRVRSKLGSPEAVVEIYGQVTRQDRRNRVAEFMNNPDVLVLIANDAAGEGVNLQRAHLMVNYDLPWNPNRLEQRFGRIHRIGQEDVCHLWKRLPSVEPDRQGHARGRGVSAPHGQARRRARCARRQGLTSSSRHQEASAARGSSR